MAGTLFAALLGSVMIWRLSPVADENKPLDEVETVRYRGLARKLTVCVNLVVLGGLWFSQTLASAGAAALLANSLMLVTGLIVHKIKAA